VEHPFGLVYRTINKETLVSTPESSSKSPVRKLGRGLHALIGSPVQIRAVAVEPKSTPPSPIAEIADTTGGPGEAIRMIAPEQIIPNRRQPRTDFDDTSIASLAESIRTAGLMQPILVRPFGQGYELIAGERRWRAARLIGLAMIPAFVRSVDDQSAAELALIENIQREDLNPMERAHALRRLVDDFSLTHQQLAERVGLDRASVTNLLRLSDLDQSTADLVRNGTLTQGHAKALLSLQDSMIRGRFATRAAAEGWSVRELERRVQQAVKGGVALPKSAAADATEVTARDANVADLERQLSEHLGTRVTLNLGRKKGSGRLTIDFYSLDQFDGLMGRIGFGGPRK
jgi:ParB family chromosome partitioning protein